MQQNASLENILHDVHELETCLHSGDRPADETENNGR